MDFFNSIIDTIKSATAVSTAALAITVGLAGIIAVVFCSIYYLRRVSSVLAIAVSTFLSCIIMIPVVSAFHKLVSVQGATMAEKSTENQIELKRIKAENRDNQKTLDKQSIEIETLNDKIKLLENAQLTMQSFRRAFELTLLQTKIKQQLVKIEPLNKSSSGLGINADYYHDQALVIITHDIDAKFGIDLNKVKISKLDENTVIVTGIRSKYNGAEKYVSDILLKEVRRVNYKKGIVSSVNVQNDIQSLKLADKKAAGYEAEFQRKLRDGLELNFMNDAVVQMAQSFIKEFMLAPLYKNIVFSDNEPIGAMPLIDFLQMELNDNYERKTELSDNIFIEDKRK